MALSDATNTYTAVFGFGDVSTALPSSGIFFRYTHSANGGRWQAVSRVSGVDQSVQDTGVLGAVGGNTTMEIRGSADGNTFTFFINDTLVATISGGLPPVTTSMGAGLNFIRSAGTASLMAAAYDYLMLNQDFPSRT